MAGELRKILIIGKDDSSHQYDVDLIRAALVNHGFYATNEQARILWTKFSTTLSAAWIKLPKTDDAIVTNIRPFFKPV